MTVSTCLLGLVATLNAPDALAMRDVAHAAMTTFNAKHKAGTMVAEVAYVKVLPKLGGALVGERCACVVTVSWIGELTRYDVVYFDNENFEVERFSQEMWSGPEGVLGRLAAKSEVVYRRQRLALHDQVIEVGTIPSGDPAILDHDLFTRFSNSSENVPDRTELWVCPTTLLSRIPGFPRDSLINIFRSDRDVPEFVKYSVIAKSEDEVSVLGVGSGIAEGMSGEMTASMSSGGHLTYLASTPAKRPGEHFVMEWSEVRLEWRRLENGLWLPSEINSQRGYDAKFQSLRNAFHFRLISYDDKKPLQTMFAASAVPLPKLGRVLEYSNGRRVTDYRVNQEPEESIQDKLDRAASQLLEGNLIAPR